MSKLLAVLTGAIGLKRGGMDVDTFFSHIKGELINLINQELTDLNSARIQMTTWIRFIQEFEDLVEIDRVDKVFNSRMTEVHQGSDLDRIVDGMIAHMKSQVENPTLENSRLRFADVLFLDVNFHRLNPTRGSSYLPLLDWIAKKKAIINPQNNDEECYKWAIIAVLEIGKDPQCMSNLKKFENYYNWSVLKFPFSVKDIGLYDIKNNVLVNLLVVEERDIYICRRSDHKSKKKINLLLISEDDKWQTTI